MGGHKAPAGWPSLHEPAGSPPPFFFPEASHELLHDRRGAVPRREMQGAGEVVEAPSTKNMTLPSHPSSPPNGGRLRLPFLRRSSVAGGGGGG